MNIFVAKLSPNTDEDSLKSLFGQYGEVSSVKVIMDRDTGRSKCFGFVEMSDSEGAEAIDSLNETEYQGSTIVVKKAQPRENASGPRGGGGGGYNRGGGGGGYNRGGGGGGGYNRGGNSGGGDRSGGNDRGGFRGGDRDRGGDNRGGDRGGYRGGDRDRGGDRGNSNRGRNDGFDTSKW